MVVNQNNFYWWENRRILVGTPTYMVGTCGGKTEKYRGGSVENGRSTLPPLHRREYRVT